MGYSWGICGIFGEYSRGIHMYRVCVGYVSGMYRECVETYWMRVGFLFKFRARKINFQQQKQQKINNIPLANIASGMKYKITLEILWLVKIVMYQPRRDHFPRGYLRPLNITEQHGSGEEARGFKSTTCTEYE